MKKLLLFLTALVAFAQTPQVVTYRGAIDAGDVQIHITLKVSKNADGSLSVVADSPERNAKDAKADVVKTSADGFTAEWKAVGVKCDAKYAEGGAVLNTNWDSPEGSAPAMLKRQTP
jgi:hypothetical protein